LIYETGAWRTEATPAAAAAAVKWKLLAVQLLKSRPPGVLRSISDPVKHDRNTDSHASALLNHRHRRPCSTLHVGAEKNFTPLLSVVGNQYNLINL